MSVDTNKHSIPKFTNSRQKLNKFPTQKEKGQIPKPKVYKIPIMFGTELYLKFISGSDAKLCKELSFL